MDIAANQGTNVLAISGGKVTFAGWGGTGGYMVIIQHSAKLESRYCHLGEELKVKKGQEVMMGEVIATVGPKYLSNGKLNGATTGVHLHFGIRLDGKFVNPLQFYSFPSKK